MSLFTFYTSNKIDSISTLQVIVNGTTGTAESLSSLIDRKPNMLFTTTSGGGTVTIHASLSSTQNIDSILLQNINFSNFKIMVNSSTITLPNSTEGTTTSYWTNFTNTHLLITFATLSASSVEINIYSTTSGGSRKIGQMIVCETDFTLPRNPAFADYKPVLTGNRMQKELSDGGMNVYKVSEKYRSEFTLNWVPTSVTADLYDWWNDNDAKYFTPFPTTSSWQGEVYEVNWVGDYNFKAMAQNDRAIPYYKGSVKLAETPSGY